MRSRRFDPIWLFLLLLVPALFMPLRAPYSSDEGAVLRQVALLQDGEVRSAPSLPDIDPGQHWQPVPNRDAGEKGSAPYWKHPLYPALLVPFSALGALGVLVPSIVGTVLAAIVAGRIVRLSNPRLERWVFWTTGVASPLLFYSDVLFAHSLAAAAVGASMLCWLRFVERPRWFSLIGFGVLLGLAVLLRTEALLVAIAISVLALIRWRRTTLASVPALLLAAAPVGAVVVAKGSELLLRNAFLGRGIALPGTATPTPWLQGRFDSFQSTILQASYVQDDRGAFLVLTFIGAVVGGYLLGHRKTTPALGAFAVMVGGAFLSLLTREGPPISGLLMAFPLLSVLLGLLVARCSGQQDGWVVGLILLSAGGIVATQYADGGGIEWGGRYFSLLLPLLVPCICIAIDQGVRAVPEVRVRNAVLGALIAVSVLFAVMAWQGQYDTRRVGRRTAQGLAATLQATDKKNATPILSTQHFAPQLYPEDSQERSWLIPTSAELPAAGRRLERAGYDQFVLVTRTPRADSARFSAYRVERTIPGPLAIVLLEIRGAFVINYRTQVR